MKNFMLNLLFSTREYFSNKRYLTDKKYELNRIESEIIRNVHSIEKGLCIENVKPGYGIKKINNMLQLVDEYMACDGNEIIVKFVIDSLNAYINYQDTIGFNSVEIESIRNRKETLEAKYGISNGEYGGVRILKRDELDFNQKEIDNFFYTRHSIRQFSGEKVPDEKLKKAIILAQRAPSACNRQAVRVYSISPTDYIESVGDLEGIGGFANDVDKFLLITGIKSSYRYGEKNQFIVSASFFAAYLTLSLHSQGIASCAVQRSLYADEKFRAFREKYKINDDEQIVVMIAIGMPKDTMKVPISKRHELNKIYREL